MISIPTISIPYNKIQIITSGKASKLLQEICKQLIQFTIMQKKIKNPNLIIQLTFTNKTQMQEHNKQYLNHDYPTDVISLKNEYSENELQNSPCVLGQIFFCLQVIKEQNPEKNEYHKIAHMIIHSTLHLLGYDHQNPCDQLRMESKEISLLSALNIPSPY